MKINLLTLLFLLMTITVKAQIKDTWSNVPEASDDRYTNPKKPLYAGPNGWWNTGEIRINKHPEYSMKYGFNEISVGYAFTNSNQLLTLFVDFDFKNPKDRIYTVAPKADKASGKVHISFSDVSNKQIKQWTAQGGTLEIKRMHGFIYFKARNLVCEGSGLNNQNGESITLGLEGAIKAEE